MNERIADDHAWICGDCLCLHANDDLSSFDYYYGDDAERMEREFRHRVRSNLAPKPRITGKIGENAHGQYSVTTGWGREQHPCRTNFTVTYNGDGEGRSEDSYDVLADDAEGALAEVTYGTCELNDGDTITITKHELQTVQDAGGDCDCETASFRSDYCASCGTYIHGTFHGATIYEKDAS